jgi:hypothetical protein
VSTNISPILTEIGICQYILVELPNIKFHKHQLSGSVVVTCEQTGRQTYFEVNRCIFTTFRCQHIKKSSWEMLNATLCAATINYTVAWRLKGRIVERPLLINGYAHLAVS